MSICMQADGGASRARSLAAKDEGNLLIDLGPALEDFLGCLFGMASRRLRVLAARTQGARSALRVQAAVRAAPRGQGGVQGPRSSRALDGAEARAGARWAGAARAAALWQPSCAFRNPRDAMGEGAGSARGTLDLEPGLATPPGRCRPRARRAPRGRCSRCRTGSTPASRPGRDRQARRRAHAAPAEDECAPSRGLQADRRRQ